MLAKAIAFAAEKHKDQYDKGGKPYILHCIRVMQRLHTEDQELMCVAILHDVVEDCKDVSFSDLDWLPSRVVDALKLLTKQNGQSYEEYLQGILTSQDAIRVKISDLKDNSDITRLKGVTEKDMIRLSKYAKAYKLLVEKLHG